MTHYNNYDYDYLFKIILIGNSAVGKTSLIKNFQYNQYENNYLSTIGVDFQIHTVNIDNKTVKLQIWDTAGQERFKSISRSYYKGSNGVIFVYDITDKESFLELESFIQDIETLAGKDVNKILIANKPDLECRREVSVEEAIQLANNYDMKFLQASAKTSYNTNTLFTSLIRDMIAKRENKKNTSLHIVKNTKKLSVNSDNNKSKPKCCN